MAHINVILETPGRIPDMQSLQAQDCPFCAYDGNLDLVSPKIIPNDKWCVVCPDCHAKGPLLPTVADAIQAWSARGHRIDYNPRRF